MCRKKASDSTAKVVLADDDTVAARAATVQATLDSLRSSSGEALPKPTHGPTQPSQPPHGPTQGSTHGAQAPHGLTQGSRSWSGPWSGKLYYILLC